MYLVSVLLLFYLFIFCSSYYNEVCQMLYLNVGHPISPPPWLNITKWTHGWTRTEWLFLLFPHRQSRQWNRCGSRLYNRTLVCLICPINMSYFAGLGGEWAVSLPYLSAATATRCWWPRLVLRVFSLLVFVFFTTRQESPLALRTADRSLCHRSKHFTRSIVWSPVALLLHPICITALSGVEDWAQFASTICDEFGI